MFRNGPNFIRLLMLVSQGACLVAGWVIWAPAGLGQLQLALVYVLAVWVVFGGITFGAYLAFSLARLPDLLAEAWLASANATWLVPGALLLAARSPVAVACGVAVVINSTRLLMLSRAPKGETIEAHRRVARDSEPPLFRYQPAQPVFFSRETVPTVFGALALQTGVYALAWEYPLLAAVSFATVTAVWAGMSVARGALEARAARKAPYAATGLVLTLLCTVTLTAVLLQTEIVQESPLPGPPAIDIGKPPEIPGMTRRVLQRLAHVPPPPVAPAATQKMVTQVVDPVPAIGAKVHKGFPGVVLHPLPKRGQRPPLIVPGAHLHLSSTQSLGIPFAGEYQMFRTSAGTLPAGAIVETGSPLDSVYGTTNGGPMDTVAVQTFDPRIDLTHCGKVLVALTSAETMPLMVSMQLVAEGGVEDGGTELLGMNAAAREETLEFQVPHRGRRLLVHAIRIVFRRPVDRGKNARVAVERFTLVPLEL